MQVHGAAVFAIVWSSCLVLLLLLLLLLMMIIIIIIIINIIIIMIARAEVSSLSSTGWRSLHS